MKNLNVLFALILLAACVKQTPVQEANYSGTYVITKITSSLISNTSISNNCVFENGEQYVENSEIPALDTIVTDQFLLKISTSSISFSPTISGTDTTWKFNYPLIFESFNTTLNLGRFTFFANGTKRIWKLTSVINNQLILAPSGIWPNGNAGANVQITLQLKKL
jgi:hypothetical protein